MKKYKQIFDEAKQVGTLYHYTNIENLISILKTNTLITNSLFISTTRSKTFIDINQSLKFSDARLILDGDKLSQKYKIKPYKAFDAVSKLYHTEQEEIILTKKINNILIYCLDIQVKDNIENNNLRLEIFKVQHPSLYKLITFKNFI